MSGVFRKQSSKLISQGTFTSKKMPQIIINEDVDQSQKEEEKTEKDEVEEAKKLLVSKKTGKESHSLSPLLKKSN